MQLHRVEASRRAGGKLCGSSHFQRLPKSILLLQHSTGLPRLLNLPGKRRIASLPSTCLAVLWGATPPPSARELYRDKVTQQCTSAVKKRMRIASERVMRFACQGFIATLHQCIANKHSKATAVASTAMVVLQTLPHTLTGLVGLTLGAAVEDVAKSHVPLDLP